MTFKIAFCGAGERARPYLKALARRPDVQVSAVCDFDRRAAEQVAAGWGARVHVSHDDLLAEARPDALWVCAPPRLQGEVLARAIAHGVPFFVEPPGALDYSRATAVARQVAERRLVTAVGFPARYTDVFQEAREYVGVNPVPLALGWWLRTPDDDEGLPAATLLWHDGGRLVDAMRYFSGEVDRVHALAAGGERGGLVVQLEFASGTVGVLTVAGFRRPDPRVELELLGEGWTLGFTAGAAQSLPVLSTLRLIEQDKTTILRCLNDAAADQAAVFLDAVAAGKPDAVATSYTEALHTLTVCQAAIVSAREGRPVAMAEIESSTRAPADLPTGG
jgi:predicted dehydrogenase